MQESRYPGWRSPLDDNFGLHYAIRPAFRRYFQVELNIGNECFPEDATAAKTRIFQLRKRDEVFDLLKIVARNRDISGDSVRCTWEAIESNILISELDGAVDVMKERDNAHLARSRDPGSRSLLDIDAGDGRSDPLGSDLPLPREHGRQTVTLPVGIQSLPTDFIELIKRKAEERDHEKFKTKMSMPVVRDYESVNWSRACKRCGSITHYTSQCL